ncbi:GTP-binding protein gtr2 [Fulvia fulva]|uniref:GTP-binding protein n=1 Tax=Passalora fulva TaxID=5499 RepID=A0A9Q8LAC7_PASFU|nr:GTP-binding protein gtr2 [Fulvia fulva]KAK4632385.1 GTP-binding protein gtr2 [Fulvia fulva]KAK4632934.1 GTP-binding protein gtr2 [Fulvia fulva]UJO13803.1 GTP-binding protein gtr2 [Fulvia fulva]WPV11573.1 GTP-binding protein gtr2 [Fulvia fulva]WPV26766.1 GTP-binding protein gtr2 [Fulvia fulva]
MHTLFGEAILSPGPKTVPPSKPNPFELSFQSSVATSYTDSSSSSNGKNDWLTQYHQAQDRLSGEPANQASNDATSRYGHAGHKGNPKLLFMGLRRSGKSSVQKVIFEKFSPAETLFLDPTTKIETAKMDSFIKFESSELPANLSYLALDFDHEGVFGSVGSLIWVLDMQDEYFQSISKLIETATFLLEHFPRINFEVFIHKTDGLSEEYKHDTFRDVRQRVQDELSDAGYGDRGVAFYQTSIFDHSVYEAMSKVVQKLLPQLPVMEALLNRLCSACRIQKAYLFDTISKIYLATDASPTFLKDYEVCSDYVDVIVDIKQIYGWQGRGSHQDGSQSQTSNSTESSAAVGESLITYDKSGNTYIYAREINEYLSLICVMGQGSTADKRMLIDYNVTILQEALQQMFKL